MKRKILTVLSVAAAALFLLSAAGPAPCDEAGQPRATGTSIVAVEPVEGVIGIASRTPPGVRGQGR